MSRMRTYFVSGRVNVLKITYVQRPRIQCLSASRSGANSAARRLTYIFNATFLLRIFVVFLHHVMASSSVDKLALALVNDFAGFLWNG